MKTTLLAVAILVGSACAAQIGVITLLSFGLNQKKQKFKALNFPELGGSNSVNDHYSTELFSSPSAVLCCR